MMQNLRIYLLIKDAETNETLNMDGDFKIFQCFLGSLNRVVNASNLAQAVDATDLSEEISLIKMKLVE
jgi:hypothetical protein